MDKDYILREIEKNGTFALTYRLIYDGKPTYVSLKATRMKDPDDPWPAAKPKLLDFVTQQGGMTWDEFSKDFAENGWWDNKAKFPSTWGTYRRYETGKLRKDANKKEVGYEKTDDKGRLEVTIGVK